MRTTGKCFFFFFCCEETQKVKLQIEVFRKAGTIKHLCGRQEMSQQPAGSRRLALYYIMLKFEFPKRAD